MDKQIAEFDKFSIEMNTITDFATMISSKIDGRLYLVGGAVRDLQLNIIPKDYDLELFLVTTEKFEDFLRDHNFEFKMNPDAKFPVYRVLLNRNLLNSEDEDLWVEVGFPRIDNKTGPKHSDYKCNINPHLSIEEAASRRDFTINSQYYDLQTGQTINGNNDTNSLRLIPTNVEKFKEDSLRIMRGFQFISRFCLVCYGKTLNAIDEQMVNELSNIAPCGIYSEFVKGILKNYSRESMRSAIAFLAEIGSKYSDSMFSVFHQMYQCQQNERHHAEGDVLTHTINVVSNAMELADSDEEKILLFFAALFHDVGKLKTFALKDGQPTAYGHDVESDDLVESLCSKFGLPKKLTQQVIMLKRMHMIDGAAKNKKLYVMAEELASVGLSFSVLCKLILADTYGSIKKHMKSTTRSHVEAYKLIERVKSLGIYESVLKPLITGKDIIELFGDSKIRGIVVGELLSECKNLQYAHRLNNRLEALLFLKTRITNITNK